jgi:hypothetical protein
LDCHPTKRLYRKAPDPDKLVEAIAACENQTIVGIDLGTLAERFRRSTSQATVARLLRELIAAGRVSKAIYGYVLTPTERARRAQGDQNGR